MAEIKNPALARWVSEELRPLAEQITTALANARFANDRYANDVRDIVLASDDADVILEGRDDVSPLTIQEVKAAMHRVNVLTSAMTEPQERALIKPRVRPRRVE